MKKLIADFEVYVKKISKSTNYAVYAKSIVFLQDYLSEHKDKDLHELDQQDLTDYIAYNFRDFNHWEKWWKNGGFFILNKYLEFLEKEELVNHLSSLIEQYKESSAKNKKTYQQQPRLVINLEKELGKTLAKEKIDEILEGKEGIKQATSPKKKMRFIEGVMEKVEKELDEEMVQKICASGLHKRHVGGNTVAVKYNKLFKKLGDIDQLLEIMHQDFIKQMSKTYGDDEQVMDFVINNPIHGFWGGVREGRKLIKAKFPYKIRKYLNATSEKDKKYQFCHCGWVRESLLNDDVNISRNFCYCGAGWSKQLWEAILERELETELLETVLDGDERCLFVFYLPEDVINS